MRVAPKKFVSARSMAVAIASQAISLNQIFGYSVQANATTSGTLVGVLKLQTSLDYSQDDQGNILAAGNWTDVPNSSKTLTGAGVSLWNYADAMYPYVRLVYTPGVSDTGSLDAFIFIRGF